MNFPFFLSKRLYSQRDEGKRNVSRSTIRISVIGVAVGLAVMIISVGVVFGFKHVIRDKTVGFAGHIQVSNFLTSRTAEAFPIQFGDSMLNVLRGFPYVKNVQRYAFKQGILKTDDDFLGILLKGVGEEFDDSFISQYMVGGIFPKFSSKKSSNEIVISKNMADKLNLRHGMRVFAYFIDDSGVRTRRFTVAGVYQTNLSQYDNNVCYTDLRTVVKLNGWQDDEATGAEVMLTAFKRVDDVEQIMIEKVNRTTDDRGNTYACKNIRDINPQVFSWLDLLDLNVWIILAIMAIVAAVTMISGLLIIILERTAMIGILKALGATNKTVSGTFLWFASFIVGKGLVWGNVIGLGLLLLQQLTHIIKLDAEAYYVSYVPVEIDICSIFVLNAATLLICMTVLVAPSYIVSHIHPSKSMRYE